jgi:hypothetical protein
MEWQLPSSQNVGHGASGAMAINSRYQVVGLFWGGYKDNTIDPDVHGYPSVEILNAHSPFTYGINSYNVMDNFYESLDVGSN